MLAIILASSLELCFDDAHVQPGTSKAFALHVMDILFTVTFGIEALMKIIAVGYCSWPRLFVTVFAYSSVSFLVGGFPLERARELLAAALECP